MKLKEVYNDGTVHLKVSKFPPAWYLWARPAANLLPIDHDGKFLVMHEFKAFTKNWIWGFPGGMIEKNETSRQAAIRECAEELGVEPRKVIKICEVKTDFPDTSVSYYLGTKLINVEKKSWEKIGKIKRLELEELYELALACKINDPRMVVAVLKLYEKVKQRKITLEN